MDCVMALAAGFGLNYLSIRHQSTEQRERPWLRTKAKNRGLMPAREWILTCELWTSYRWKWAEYPGGSNMGKDGGAICTSAFALRTPTRCAPTWARNAS